MGLRGADVIAKSLALVGTRHVFALSGNHIMSVFDAALDANLSLVHVRHEAAAVHMAHAWARLTGEVGIALLTGGPGHANGISALYTALAGESPVVLLSGQAPLAELGQGAFQEMRQAEMAAPVTKASWTVQSAEALGEELARAIRLARSGRPGPVHLSLPVDLLEATVERALPDREAFAPCVPPRDERALRMLLAALASAKRPLVLAGPAMTTEGGRALLAGFSDATGVPAVPMESPRGVSDPSLGDFADVLKRADVVALVGKRLDYALKFGKAFGAECRVIDAGLEPNAAATFAGLIELAGEFDWPGGGWLDDAQAALRYRPSGWADLASARGGPVHPVEVCRALQKLLDTAPASVVVIDGGEFGQWAQSLLTAPHRMINGPAGAIGPALPFALAARLAFPSSLVACAMGDGTCGYHLSEFDTAVRHGLPVLAVVGNDARWNAEYQIQVRAYGPERTYGCELLPGTRYDRVCEALGGHGEYVTCASELPAALARAVQSHRPACVNVRIEGLPAPSLHRS